MLIFMWHQQFASSNITVLLLLIRIALKKKTEGSTESFLFKQAEKVDSVDLNAAFSAEEWLLQSWLTAGFPNLIKIFITKKTSTFD